MVTTKTNNNFNREKNSTTWGHYNLFGVNILVFLAQKGFVIYKYTIWYDLNNSALLVTDER